MTMRRIGLFGGSFDPPHVGHLHVANAAREQLNLDELRFIVAARPWMKSTVATPEQRLAMTRLLVDGHDGVTVDDRELRRDGPTYTVDTLEAIRAEEPDIELVFLLGVDTAAHLDAWHRIDDAFALASFVALTRPGYQPPPTLTIPVIAVPERDVSSQEVRQRLENGEDVARLVPDTVLDYINRHGLYPKR